MARPGRPSKEGKKDSTALLRAMIALCAYDQARQARTKYDPAVESAIEAVRHALPEVAMSNSEMKRVLAAFRPRSHDEVLLVERTDPGSWTLKVGPRPNDRVNRRD